MRDQVDHENTGGLNERVAWRGRATLAAGGVSTMEPHQVGQEIWLLAQRAREFLTLQ